MDHYRFPESPPRLRDDLSGGIHGFDLIFRNLLRIIAEEGVCGDYNILEGLPGVLAGRRKAC